MEADSVVGPLAGGSVAMAALLAPLLGERRREDCSWIPFEEENCPVVCGLPNVPGVCGDSSWANVSGAVASLCRRDEPPEKPQAAAKRDSAISVPQVVVFNRPSLFFERLVLPVSSFFESPR